MVVGLPVLSFMTRDECIILYKTEISDWTFGIEEHMVENSRATFVFQKTHQFYTF